MTPNDMIYNSVFKGCLKEGLDEYCSKDAAVIALQKYKNNQFEKPSKLVDQSIKDAVRKFKKRKKKWMNQSTTS